MIDLRSKLANLVGKHTLRRTRAKLEALVARAVEASVSGPEAANRLEKMREAQALLAADEPTRAMEIVDALVATGHNDVVLVILWAQAAAALGRYREAFTVNDSAIKLAEAGGLTRLAISCRTWQRELAWRVARES